MKLLSLEVAGFKSFADPTVFQFDSGITGIVGPNGCGKSNVVDAVKWVLGEMSAKSLRGDGMLDVIFNGSSTRKPLGMAEVSLVFSNEDRRLPVDEAQVKITRRLYRDGTSEYLVNNRDSRLRDIREMFLDTGVGVDAYSLIEQGRISALLEANSIDRREIFEEAAGISRFKARKKEALRRLEKTDQNLAQTQLVLDEVLKQLRSVKVQAGKARNYKEYESRLNELRRSQSLYEFHQMHHRLTDLNNQHADAVDLQAATRREHESRQAALSDLQIEFGAVQDSVRQAERALAHAESTQQSLLQQADFAARQHRQLQDQRRMLVERRADIEARLTGLTTAIDVQSRSMASAEALLAQTQANQKAAAAELETENARLREIINNSEKMKVEAVDLLRQAAVLQNQLSGLEVQKQTISRQLDSLTSRREIIMQRQHAALVEMETLEREKLAGEARLGEDMAQINRLEADRTSNNQMQTAVSQKLSAAREMRSSLLSRTHVLQELQSRREGMAAPIKEILKQREAGAGYHQLRGILSDLIDADLDNAKLVEAALGDYAGSLVFDSIGMLGDDYEKLRGMAGRIHIWLLDQIPPTSVEENSQSIAATHDQAGDAGTPPTDDLPCVLNFARFADDLRPLVQAVLGHTLVAHDLTQAMAHRQNHPGFSYVLSSGELLRPNGLLTIGKGGQVAGTIARRSELAHLAQQLATCEQEVAQWQQELSAIDQKAAEFSSMLKSRRDQHLQMQNEAARTAAKYASVKQEADRLAGEIPLLDVEQTGLEQQAEKCLAQQTELRAKAAEIEQRAQQAEMAAKQSADAIENQRQITAKVAEKATALRVDMGRLQEQRAAIMRELSNARQQLQDSASRLNQVDVEMVAIDQRAQETLDSAEKFKRDAEALKPEIDGHRTRVTSCNARLSEISTQRSEAQSALAQLQTELDQVSRRVHELSLAQNEASVRLETLVERTSEELAFNLIEAHEGYAPPEDVNWDQVNEEINDLRGKIARLGNVNLDAVTELETLEQREAFLTAQMADIADAKKQLEDLIGKINEDSQVRFVETFEAVRREFQETFRLLFGGGKADVMLENPDDVLESGIEILARPPGKELQSITLMSGGEKALTAIALVLAVFKSRPSPFCILDEVDAPLDEANTGRFAAIIQQFLQHSQFVVITHNKRMMAVADLLYGITMQEQGVSRKVAVKFDGKARLQDDAGPRADKAQSKHLVDAAP